MDQKYTADIVIIGRGVIGCSTAYNLANQGAKKIVLLEKGENCFIFICFVYKHLCVTPTNY